jgi:hypothetical protein
MEADDFEDVQVFEFGRQEDRGHDGSEPDGERDAPFLLQQKRKRPPHASDDSGEFFYLFEKPHFVLTVTRCWVIKSPCETQDMRFNGSLV